MKRITRIAASSLLLALMSFVGFGTAYAGPISCPDTVTLSDREMTISEAQACGYVNYNPQDADIDAFMGSSGWFELQKIEEADGTSGSSSDGILTIALASGDTWGDDPDKMMSGTWTITDANFWTNYSSAVLSFHFGGGQGSPDGWMFSLTFGELTGSWTYDGSCCNGGGLSNVKLWVNEVPEPMTLLLLGAGLFAMGLRRRKVA